jgi:hypothetical protein
MESSPLHPVMASDSVAGPGGDVVSAVTARTGEHRLVEAVRVPICSVHDSVTLARVSALGNGHTTTAVPLLTCVGCRLVAQGPNSVDAFNGGRWARPARLQVMVDVEVAEQLDREPRPAAPHMWAGRMRRIA